MAKLKRLFCLILFCIGCLAQLIAAVLQCLQRWGLSNEASICKTLFFKAYTKYTIFHLQRGWESCGGSAWAREGSGASAVCMATGQEGAWLFLLSDTYRLGRRQWAQTETQEISCEHKKTFFLLCRLLMEAMDLPPGRYLPTGLAPQPRIAGPAWGGWGAPGLPAPRSCSASVVESSCVCSCMPAKGWPK